MHTPPHPFLLSFGYRFETLSCCSYTVALVCAAYAAQGQADTGPIPDTAGLISIAQNSAAVGSCWCALFSVACVGLDMYHIYFSYGIHFSKQNQLRVHGRFLILWWDSQTMTMTSWLKCASNLFSKGCCCCSFGEFHCRFSGGEHNSSTGLNDARILSFPLKLPPTFQTLLNHRYRQFIWIASLLRLHSIWHLKHHRANGCEPASMSSVWFISIVESCMF